MATEDDNRLQRAFQHLAQHQGQTARASQLQASQQLQAAAHMAMARGLNHAAPQEAQSEAKPVEPEIRNDDADRAYAAFVDAARGLRDAELAVRRAGAVYRSALDALNRAVAPTDAGADGQ